MAPQPATRIDLCDRLTSSELGLTCRSSRLADGFTKAAPATAGSPVTRSTGQTIGGLPQWLNAPQTARHHEAVCGSPATSTTRPLWPDRSRNFRSWFTSHPTYPSGDPPPPRSGPPVAPPPTNLPREQGQPSAKWRTGADAHVRTDFVARSDTGGVRTRRSAPAVQRLNQVLISGCPP